MNNQSEDRVLGYVGTYPVGDYNAQTEYEYLNVVTHRGSSYVCIKEEGCIAVEPPNEECWQLFAGKGDTGEKGDKGDTGPIGPKPVNRVDYNTNAEREEFKNAVVADSKADLEKYITEKETHLDNYTKEEETKLDTYVTDTVKPTIDTYVTDTTKKGIDAYEKEKEKVLDTYTDTKKTEIDNYVTNTSKPALDQYEKDKEAELETAKNTAISEYDAHAESVLTETGDLFNALDTEKASGTELYIEDAKPCRVINAGISGMYKQETTTGANIMNLNVAQNSKVTVNEDGTVTINGTGGFGLAFESFTFKANTPYYIKWEIVSGNIPTDLSLVFYNSINSKWLAKDIFNTITPTEDKEISSFWIHPNTKFENAKIRIWISKSQSDFESYTGAIASPNPDYPKEIEQIKEVKYCGTAKNLINFNEISGNVNNFEYSVNGTYININGTSSGTYATSKKMRCNIKKNEVVTIKITSVKSGTYRLWIRNKKNEMITNPIICAASVSGIKTITVKDNVETVQLVVEGLTAGATYTDTVTIQIEKGQNATEIEEYKEQKVSIDLKGNKLCAVSDTIKDKLLIDRNGNVALQKNVEQLILIGTEKYLENETWNREDMNIYHAYVELPKFKGSNTENLITNRLTFKRYNVYSNYYGKEIAISRRNKNILYLFIKAERLENLNLEGLKKYITEHNVTMFYELANPELIDLGQIPELPKTFEGINNIWAETNLGNTEIEIEYVQDVKKLLEKQAEQQNARLDNIEALLSTTETSALLLDNMQTDLESEVK